MPVVGLLPALFRGLIVAAVGGAGTQSSFKQLAFLLRLYAHTTTGLLLAYEAKGTCCRSSVRAGI